MLLAPDSGKKAKSPGSFSLNVNEALFPLRPRLPV